ncbi:hypothetical protein Q1695_008679 [Nippostrongylus brasiliensis]|nr:hypothetical protein Q1695_008679 [Nippostrongylus brasiliensis]
MRHSASLPASLIAALWKSRRSSSEEQLIPRPHIHTLGAERDHYRRRHCAGRGELNVRRRKFPRRFAVVGGSALKRPRRKRIGFDFGAARLGSERNGAGGGPGALHSLRANCEDEVIEPSKRPWDCATHSSSASKRK